MSSVKSALILLGVGAFVASAAVACSSSSSPSGFEDGEDSGLGASLPKTDAAPPPPTDSSFPPPIDAGVISPLDGSTKDAATDAASGDSSAPIDAGVDAAPDASADAGPTGSPCSPADSIGTQTCGLCGTQSRLCAPASAAAGAPLVWQEWGFCQNEVMDGCVPGTATTDACGLCGTRNKVCQSDCRYAVGACKNEPVNACSPGNVDYQVGLSCATGGRSRTCDATCNYGAFGDCFVPGAPTLTLSTTAGQKVFGQFTLPAATTAGRLSGTCPVSSFSTVTSYTYVTIVNPSASTATVSVWSEQSTHAGSVYIDTVIASYTRDTAPVSDAERKACVKGVNDTCSSGGDPAACVSSWGGLVGSDVITIAPNGKAVIYVGAYYATDHGDFQLTARTDTLNP